MKTIHNLTEKQNTKAIADVQSEKLEKYKIALNNLIYYMNRVEYFDSIKKTFEDLLSYKNCWVFDEDCCQLLEFILGQAEKELKEKSNE